MKAPTQSNGSVSDGAKMALAQASQTTLPQVPQAKGTYELQKLRGRHHLILQLAAKGMKGVEIAKVLNISAVAVSYTINSELGQQKLAVLLGEADLETIDVIKEFGELAPVAIEVIEEVLLKPGAKDSDRLSAAEKILNGAGFARRQQLDINVHHVTDEEIQEAKIQARQRGRLAGVVIEDAEIIAESDGEQGEVG